MEVSEILALVLGVVLGLTVIILLFLINRSNRGRISVTWEVNHRPIRSKDDGDGRIVGSEEAKHEIPENDGEEETEGGPHAP